VLRTLSLCTCCRHYPGAADGRNLRSCTQPYQPSPISLSGRPARRFFRGLLGVHSRCGLHTRTVTKSRPLSRGFRHFVTSMPAPVASGWSGCRVGLAPTGKRRLARRTGHATTDTDIRFKSRFETSEEFHRDIPPPTPRSEATVCAVTGGNIAELAATAFVALLIVLNDRIQRRTVRWRRECQSIPIERSSIFDLPGPKPTV
jgi:hypothetical protein